MIRIMVAVLVLAGHAAFAQEGAVQFNLLRYEGAYTAETYTFDAEFAAEYGMSIPMPFYLEVPRRKGVERIADGKPDGGVVKFTFATDPERQFIENLHILTATFGAPADAEDPMAFRLQVAAQVLREQAFPMAMDGFTNAQILALGPLNVGAYQTMELVGSYDDPVNGPMLIRIVAFVNPDREDSYVMLNNISRTLVPAQNAADLAATLAGRTMSSFRYLP